MNGKTACGACAEIINIIETIENRCMAADGPVTPTTQEITEEELRKIYQAARRGAGLVPEGAAS